MFSGANEVAKNLSRAEAYSSLSKFFLIERPEKFYSLSDKRDPRQNKMESSLQMQAPQQSPFLLCILFKSSRKNGENIVRKEK